MDKETLSNYGWIVICVLVLAVMLALATPFGTFIAGAIKSTTAGLFSVNQAALGSAGIDVNDMVFENCDHLETEVRNATDTYTGDTCCKACGAVLQAGQTVKAKIPEGGYYYVGVTSAHNNKNYSVGYECSAKYGPGEEFPETVSEGDVYVYGDYQYRYNQSYYWYSNGVKDWGVKSTQNGWGVRVLSDSKTSYGEILSAINGVSVNSLDYTFAYCKSLNVSPVIPNTIVSMTNSFDNCTALSENGLPVIPASVNSMKYTFARSGITNLNNYLIPNNVTNMEGAFNGCKSLVEISEFVIPSSVTSVQATFAGCDNLTTLPTIQSGGVTDLNATFVSCKSLTDISDFVIPNSVTQLTRTFESCTSLTNISNFVIPTTVTKLTSTFKYCSGLTDDGLPILPDTITYMAGVFGNCTSLIDLSEYKLPSSLTNMQQTFGHCTSLKKAPIIPNSVTSMFNTFMHCTSLIEKPAIPSVSESMECVFYGCTQFGY